VHSSYTSSESNGIRFCTDCGEVMGAAPLLDWHRDREPFRGELSAVSSGSHLTKDTIDKISLIAAEIESKSDLSISAHTLQRVQNILDAFQKAEELRIFSNTETVVRAAFVVELRRSGVSVPLEKMMPNNTRDQKSVTRYIARICQSLRIGLAPSKPKDMIAEHMDKISTQVTGCASDTHLKHLSMKLFDACRDSGTFAPSRSLSSAALVCCYFVLKSQSPGLSLRQCIRAASLENSEKTCYRDHKDIKKFIEKGMLLGKFSDLQSLLKNLDQVMILFHSKDSIRNRLIHA